MAEFERPVCGTRFRCVNKLSRHVGGICRKEWRASAMTGFYGRCA